MVTIKKLAGILLVFLILFILWGILTNLYGQTFEGGIKKLLGEKTESEVTHEQNTQAKNAFENLKKQIEKCQNSKDENCGCLVNLNQFGNNHLINFSDNEIKLIDIKNIRDNSKEGEGIQMDHADIKLNCYWNNNFEMEEFSRIVFANEKAYVFKGVWGWTSISGRGNSYYFTHNFNLLKINNKLCWLTDKVKENKIQSIKECQ